jgi:DNA-binding YbaB/EbfC family protein
MDENAKMPDLSGLLQTAQRVQQEIARVQDELAQQTVEASAGGGMVTAVVNGRQELVALHIDSECIDPRDPSMLQDLVVAAVNQALRKAQGLAQAEMGKVAGGLSIPGLF